MTKNQLTNKLRETLRVLTGGSMLAQRINTEAYKNLKETLRSLTTKTKK